MTYRLWIKTRTYDQDYKFLASSSKLPDHFDQLTHFNELNIDLKLINPSHYYLYISGLESQRRDVANRVIRYTIALESKDTHEYLGSLIDLVIFHPQKLIDILEENQDIDDLYNRQDLHDYEQMIDQKLKEYHLLHQIDTTEYDQWFKSLKSLKKYQISSFQKEVFFGILKKIFTLKINESVNISFVTHLDHIKKYEEYFSEYRNTSNAIIYLLLFRNRQIKDQYIMIGEYLYSRLTIWQKLKQSVQS